MKSNKFQEQMYSGSIDRRTFLGSAISVALGTMLLPVVGCASQADATKAQQEPRLWKMLEAPAQPPIGQP